MVMPELPLLSTVALLEDMPEESLRRGQVGTIVELLAPGVYEVEFSDDEGRTYASLGIGAEFLLPLLHEPASQAA
jgi:hypothetical protein